MAPSETANNSRSGGCREVLSIAWPLIVSTGSFTVMLFCDRMFLAWHSSVAIQAALPAGIMSFTLICGFMALAAYASTFVAQYYGAGDLQGCARSTAQGLYIALLSWPVILVLILPGRWLLGISGHSPEVLAAELPYFTILMFGGLTAPLSAAASSFFTGRGKTTVTMTANIIGNLCNIFLDYVLIFGKLGFPELGMPGAAWATVVSGFVGPCILTVLLLSGPVNAEYNTRRSLGFDRALFWRIIRFGAPSGVHLALDIASFSVFVLLTGRMGAQALSASNIALSINLIAFLPLVGLGIAASILVGQYQGRGESHLAERTGWSALKLGLLYMAAAGFTFLVFPDIYYSFFVTSAEAGMELQDLLPLGRRLLVIMTVWGFMDAGNMIIGSALKGAGDTRFVMYYSVAVAWFVLVAGQLALVLVAGCGIIASWIWTAVYISVLAAGFLWRFRSGRWKSIRVIDPVPPLEPARPSAEAFVIGD